MEYENYEVIDLSAHGLYRGLLVANQSRHDVQPAPPLPEEHTTRDWIVSDAITTHVLSCLDVETFKRMRDLVQETKHSKESVRAALKRLVREGAADFRHADYPSGFRRTRLEWRRTR